MNQACKQAARQARCHLTTTHIELLVLEGEELGVVHELRGVDHRRPRSCARLGVVRLDGLAHKLHHRNRAANLEPQTTSNDR